ncbi:hypothetical protein HDU76_007657 [Blyttiomyces sp. JEL0837]|nr:hypothetical protein HDU76_007657 [Blyttiomyces sp. JEL0837]
MSILDWPEHLRTCPKSLTPESLHSFSGTQACTNKLGEDRYEQPLSDSLIRELDNLTDKMDKTKDGIKAVEAKPSPTEYLMSLRWVLDCRNWIIQQDTTSTNNDQDVDEQANEEQAVLLRKKDVRESNQTETVISKDDSTHTLVDDGGGGYETNTVDIADDLSSPTKNNRYDSWAEGLEEDEGGPRQRPLKVSWEK